MTKKYIVKNCPNLQESYYADGHETIEELQAENDRIKSELMQTNCYLDADKEIIDKLKGENKHLNDLLNQSLKDYDKSMQILAEIKEIAEKIEDECGYLGFGSCANKAKEQILQIISEVTND